MEQTSGMYSQTRLQKRGSTFYFRAMIPADLRARYGKREVVYSLRTSDRREAERLVRQASARLDDEFEVLRGCHRDDPPKRLSVVDDAAIEAVCGAWRHAALDGDAWYRSHGLSEVEYEERAGDRVATLDALRDMLAKGRLERIQPALEQFLHLIGVEFVGTSDEMRRLGWQFLEAVVGTHYAIMQRDRGEVVATPAAPASTLLAPASPNTPQETPAAPSGPTLSQLHDDWARLVPDRPTRTVEVFEAVINDLARFVGNKPADAIERANLIAYRDHLLTERRLHHGTVRKRLSYLSAVFQVAVDGLKLAVNPAARIKIPRPKVRIKSRLPFDTEDLTKIFASPIYTGGVRPRAGAGEASVWLPLLGLYTGCREEELAQLEVQDIKERGRIAFIEVSDETGAAPDSQGKRQLKTESSRRRVPVHPALIEAGFLHYVVQLKAAGGGWLFPNLRPDCYGKRSGNWSKWWGRYLRGVIGIVDPRKVYHSFRHSFRDACREAELDEEISDALMGHSGGDRIGRDYGRSFSLKRLHVAIRRIEYPGVRIPVIVPPEPSSGRQGGE